MKTLSVGPTLKSNLGHPFTRGFLSFVVSTPACITPSVVHIPTLQVIFVVKIFLFTQSCQPPEFRTGDICSWLKNRTNTYETVDEVIREKYSECVKMNAKRIPGDMAENLETQGLSGRVKSPAYETRRRGRLKR